MTNLKGVVKRIERLKKDLRKTPEQYRQHVVFNVAAPSQLSVRTISEYYNYPSAQFKTYDDVFTYRGYKKLDKIDEGAFGIVSKAVRLSDKLQVAVKEVDLRKRKAKRIEEMKRELFVLQKVSHETVVGLVEHFIIGQTLVIIMEYCAGSNLTACLKDKAIKEEDAVGLFRQMATAIRVLHKKGIAHRDVKLNNFLLNSARTAIKIADFGLSVVSYRQNQGVLMAKTYCGTEPYMAPELLRRNHLNARCYNPLYADIWSLGVCLFAMLTRTFPFKMHTTHDGLFKAQMARRWRFPRSLRGKLSDEIKDLVCHMLDPEAERRITINGVLAHPWLNQNQLVALTYEEGENTVTISRNTNSESASSSGTTSVVKNTSTPRSSPRSFVKKSLNRTLSGTALA